MVTAANNNVGVASSVPSVPIKGGEATALRGESAETGGKPCTLEASEPSGVTPKEAGIINCIRTEDHKVVASEKMKVPPKAYISNHRTAGPIELASVEEPREPSNGSTERM